MGQNPRGISTHLLIQGTPAWSGRPDFNIESDYDRDIESFLVILLYVNIYGYLVVENVFHFNVILSLSFS